MKALVSGARAVGDYYVHSAFLGKLLCGREVEHLYDTVTTVDCVECLAFMDKYLTDLIESGPEGAEIVLQAYRNYEEKSNRLGN
jgi:hypothetical protein